MTAQTTYTPEQHRLMTQLQGVEPYRADPCTTTPPPVAQPAAAPAPAAEDPKQGTALRLYYYFATTYNLINYGGRAYAVPGRSGYDHMPPELAHPIEGAPGIAQPIGAELRRRIVRVGQIMKGIPPVSRATADTVLLQLEAEAFEGSETPLALRFHHTPDRVCLDLGRRDGAVVTITANGWTVGPAPKGVVFRRSHATKPLPRPVMDGRLDALAPLLALEPTSEQFRALVGWLIGLPFVSSVRPGVLMVGAPGTGKSTRLRLATSIVEPSDTGALGSSFGRNIDDDQVRALHRAVPLWDNLTAISGEGSDEICRLVTGTAREGRAYFTKSDLDTSPIMRALGLTAVGVPAGLRPDALDRLIVLDMPPIAERIDDTELQRQFDDAHPRLLGALCDAVAGVLRRRDHIVAPGAHRMASHAAVLAAVDGAQLWGCPAGLLDAYATTHRRIVERTAAEDTFGGAVLALVSQAKDGVWKGKASELRAAAAACTAFGESAQAGWPGSARAVPAVLAQLQGGLAALGVTWTTEAARAHTTVYTFTYRESP